MSNDYRNPPPWDPKKTTQENARILADFYAGAPSGGGSGTTASTPQVKPPEGFTKEVPGSNGTAWFNPTSGYIWSAPQGTNGTPYTSHASAIEADRIMGAGWSAGQKEEAKPAAVVLPPIPDYMQQRGFHYVPGQSDAYSATYQGTGKTNTSGSIAYIKDGQWVIQNASPQQADLYKAAGTAVPATTGAATTQPAVGAMTQPATGAAATTQPAAAGAVAQPAPAPAAPGSPYAQTNAATTSGGITPDRYGPPLALTVPFTFDPKTGMQNIVDAQGKTSQQFVPFMASYTPYVAQQPTAAAVPGPAAAAPIPGTSAGLVSARPEANQGVPTPVAAAGAPASIFRPPNVGDAGLAAGMGATGPASAPGGIDLSPYHGQWLADGSAWFPIRGGATVPPEMVSLIARTWADTPGNIPQMLGIAARESGGNPTASGLNGPGTGAPGTRDVGLFQINQLNWPSLGLNAQNVLDPTVNAQAARTLFDRSQGAGPWGGPDIYNPRGYAWAQNLESGRPPPNTVGGIRPPNTGDAGLTRPIGAAAPLAQPGGMLPSARDQFMNTPTDPFNTGLPRGAPTPAPAPPPGATGAADQTPLGPAAAAATLPPPVQFSTEGQQTVHYGDMSHGLNIPLVLKGAGFQSTGNLAQDAAIAIEIVRNQAPGGAYGDILANKAPGTATTFQSPLSGGLQNEIRTDAGYSFSAGNVNAGPSLRSPMSSEANTPVMTPQGIVMGGANRGSQTPAAQAVAYQQAGYGVPQLGGPSGRDLQRDPATGNIATYPLAPTSNVGAVIQAGQAQAREPVQAGQFFEGSANLAGPNPNSNLSLPGVGYASAANLPSENQLQALGQGNQAIQDQMNREWEAAQAAAQAGAGGGMYGEAGGTRFMAQGGRQTLREPAALVGLHSGHVYSVAGEAGPETATFTPQKTMPAPSISMAGPGTHYSQGIRGSESGIRGSMSGIRGYKTGGSVTIYDDPGVQPQPPTTTPPNPTGPAPYVPPNPYAGLPPESPIKIPAEPPKDAPLPPSPTGPVAPGGPGTGTPVPNPISDADLNQYSLQRASDQHNRDIYGYRWSNAGLPGPSAITVENMPDNPSAAPPGMFYQTPDFAKSYRDAYETLGALGNQRDPTAVQVDRLNTQRALDQAMQQRAGPSVREDGSPIYDPAGLDTQIAQLQNSLGQLDVEAQMAKQAQQARTQANYYAGRIRENTQPRPGTLTTPIAPVRAMAA